MKGIEREIDRLGRVVIPMEYRKELGIEYQSRVLILLSNGEIVIRPHKRSCALCGEILEGERNIPLCDSCIEKTKNET